MRAVLLTYLALVAGVLHADIAPETVGTTTLGTPADTWVLVKNALGSAYAYDAASGDMLGVLSLTPFTPAVQPNIARGEIYAAERYYSRRYRGTRTDVLTIYDAETLAPTGEIDLPEKIASLPFRHYINLLGNDRHLAIFNMTPAQSVSIVDVRDKSFVGEISTPGCALMLPTGERSFLMLCGDGALQLIRLNRRGEEAARTRSDEFFDIDDDPVYDKPVPTPDGWLLVSYEGRVFDVSTDGDDISVGEPWSILNEEDTEEDWRIGGGQIVALHRDLDVMYTLMHQGDPYTHEDAGTEIWVFNRGTQRRIARITLETPVTNLYITQNDAPLLLTSTEEGQIDIYDGLTTAKVRTIEKPGVVPAMFQSFK
ncbi:MAG: amine dehydrogenase large subunit [Gammaproteobacteria bacterium]|nr:amine dehydrogenase large subunit [Gammaproteobacteria bacterium]